MESKKLPELTLPRRRTERRTSGIHQPRRRAQAAGTPGRPMDPPETQAHLLNNWGCWVRPTQRHSPQKKIEDRNRSSPDLSSWNHILGQRWLSREPPFRWEPALIPQLLLRTGDGCQPEIDSKPRHWETPSAWPRHLVVGTHVPWGGVRTRQSLGRRDVQTVRLRGDGPQRALCCDPGFLGADKSFKNLKIQKSINSK